MPDPIAPHTRRPLRHRTTASAGLVLAIASLFLPACASDDSITDPIGVTVDPATGTERPSTTIDQLAAAAEAEAARQPGNANRDLPLPALLTGDGVAVTPLTGEALDKASVDLDTVLERIQTPDYLAAPGTPKADPPVPLNDDPPLAAVKAYVRGLAAFRNNKRFEAINQLEAARRLDPQSPHILRLLGRVYFTYRNEVKGAQRLEQAVRLDPADAESLFLLGRVAFARQRWDEAIATLARSSRIEDSELDPGTPYQLSYYLSQALFQRGFDAAAIDQAEAYAKLPDRLGRTTRMRHALGTLERQRGRVYTQIGDALLRLGRFAEAADYYAAAGDLDDDESSSDALAARRVYSLLAIDRPRSAEFVIVDRLAAGDASTDLLSLVPYVAEHCGRSKRFAAIVRSVYEQADRPGPLAMAVAGMLEPDDAVALLAEHLDERPTELAVYRFLVERYGSDHPRRVLPVALTLIRNQPDAAREYATQLTALAVDADAWLAQLDKLPAAQRDGAAAWYLRGAVHESADRIEQAADAYDKALAADGDFLSPHTATIQLQLRLGRYDRALALLDRIKPPVDDALRFARVRAYLGLARFADAQAALDDLIAAQPRNADYRLTKSRIQIARDDLTGAQATLWSILNFAPTNEDAYAALFALYESDKWDDKSQWVRLLKEVQQQIPTSRIARLKLAEYLIRAERYDQAITALNELLTFKPDDAEALTVLTRAYYRAEKFEEAERVLLDHMRRRPNDLVPMILLEPIAERLNKMDDYLVRKEKFLLARDPSYENSVLLARMYLDWGKKDKAAEALEQAIESKGDASYELRTDLARLLFVLDKHDRALEVLDDAIARHPAHAADLYYDKSSLLHRLDRHADAEAALLKALEANPDHVSANNDLGYFWADAGKNLDRALAMTRKAVQLNTNNERAGGYIDSYAWALYKLGRFAEAARQLELARTKADGNDPVILDHYGDALWRLNQKPRASQVWQDALRAAAAINEKDRPSIKELRDALTAKIRAAIANEPPPVAPVPGHVDEPDKPDDAKPPDEE